MTAKVDFFFVIFSFPLNFAGGFMTGHGDGISPLWSPDGYACGSILTQRGIWVCASGAEEGKQIQTLLQIMAK